jgi:hypothetical protein
MHPSAVSFDSGDGRRRGGAQMLLFGGGGSANSNGFFRGASVYPWTMCWSDLAVLETPNCLPLPVGRCHVGM